jgi:hypothetical protein
MQCKGRGLFSRCRAFLPLFYLNPLKKAEGNGYIKWLEGRPFSIIATAYPRDPFPTSRSPQHSRSQTPLNPH